MSIGRSNRFSLRACLLFCCIAHAQSGSGRSSALAKYDFQERNPVQIQLPRQLREISGLAMTADGRLFAHNDEVGMIYQIDNSDGKILKSFSVGKRIIRGDFEDIAIVNKEFYLVSSHGWLHKFSEGKDNEHVPYEVYRTPLTLRQNVEGLRHDPQTNSLLLACKDFPGKGLMGSRAIYSFSLRNLALEKKPRFLISLQELRERFGFVDFKPSGIARNPVSGSFFVLSAHEPAIVELAPTGKILGAVRLPQSLHRQPEGIAFAADLKLFISNEGARRGYILVYPMNK